MLKSFDRGLPLDEKIKNDVFYRYMNGRSSDVKVLASPCPLCGRQSRVAQRLVRAANKAAASRETG